MSIEVDEFSGSLSGLEERIVKAVELVGELRRENQQLREQLARAEKGQSSKLESALQEAAEAKAQYEKLLRELDSLRSERKQVRTRIEKLLGQMDLLSAEN